MSERSQTNRRAARWRHATEGAAKLRKRFDLRELDNVVTPDPLTGRVWIHLPRMNHHQAERVLAVALAAGVRLTQAFCEQCGNRVPEARECYVHPTCYACLPPPEPLPIAHMRPLKVVDDRTGADAPKACGQCGTELRMIGPHSRLGCPHCQVHA